ncbi:MAG: hypothetical protein WCJ29_04115 [bacterium]
MAHAPGTPAAPHGTASAPAAGGGKPSWADLIKKGFDILAAVATSTHHAAGSSAAYASRAWKFAQKLFHEWNFLWHPGFPIAFAVWAIFWELVALPQMLFLQYSWKLVLGWLPITLYFIVIYYVQEALLAGLYGVTELLDKGLQLLGYEKADVIDTNAAIRDRIQPIFRGIAEALLLFMAFRLLDHSGPGFALAFFVALFAFAATLYVNPQSRKIIEAAKDSDNYVDQTHARHVTNTSRLVVELLKKIFMVLLLAHMALNMVWVRGIDCSRGESWVLTMVEGAETSWNATLDDVTGIVNTAQAERVVAVIDDVGKQALLNHWLRGGSKVLEGVENLSKVNCYNFSTKVPNERCIKVLASTGAPVDEVRENYKWTSSWTGTGLPKVDALPITAALDESQRALAVARLTVSMNSQCWKVVKGTEYFSAECYKQIARYRVRPEYFDDLLSWRPWTWFSKTPAVSVQFIDRKNGLPFGEKTFFLKDGNVDDPEFQQELTELMDTANQQRADNEYSHCVDRQTGFGELARYTSQDFSVTKRVKLERQMSENPDLQDLVVEQTAERTVKRAAALRSLPTVKFTAQWFTIAALFLAAFVLILSSLRWQIILVLAMIFVIGSALLMGEMNQVDVLQMIGFGTVMTFIAIAIALASDITGAGKSGGGHKPAAKAHAAPAAHGHGH